MANATYRARERAVRLEAQTSLTAFQEHLTWLLDLDPTMPVEAFAAAFLVGRDVHCQFEEETVREVLAEDGSWDLEWSDDVEDVVVTGTVTGVTSLAAGHFELNVEPVWFGERRTIPGEQIAFVDVAL